MQLARYAVEVQLPDSGWDDLQRATSRAKQAAEDLRREGAHVRFLRSIYVPEDGACFFLYEGPSARTIRAAALRAELGIRGVAAALTLDEEAS